MAEGDEDKEADVIKPRSKRPLDHVPLKIVIRRKRPNAEVQAAPSPSPTVPAKKPKVSTVVPLHLLVKYAEIAELMNAFETVKPRGLQEVWHSVRLHQQEEEDGKGKNGKRSLQGYYASGQCDFGADCEMPWLHPSINCTSWENTSQEKCEKNDVELFISNVSKELVDKDEFCEDDHCNVNNVHFSDWRFGAAKLWFDKLGVTEKCEDFTYGFKLKEQPSDGFRMSSIFSDDAFLMVTQLPWENDVIWNAARLEAEAVDKMKSKWKSVGGIVHDRSYALSRYSYQHKLPGYLQLPRGHDFFQRSLIFKSPHYMQVPTILERDDENSWKSIFPFQNEDLVSSPWENEVIWDPENMSHLPRPSIPTLDPNDDNVVLGVPDEMALTRLELETQIPSSIKLSHPHVKDVKLLIGKSGISSIKDQDEQHFSLDDPFNVSNDSYYALKSCETSLRLKPVGKLIHHSIPVLELRPPFIPTHLNIFRLQNFHRIPLKRYSHGLMSRIVAHSVHSLSKEINLKAMLREEEIKASGGGEVFFMREAEDLSGRDGELVLFEFCEEHPLLMNEVGMCSKIINYYKRMASKDHGPPQFKYGDIVYPHTSPFLGVLSPGQCVQAVENNLYRCPIFQQKIKETDFLVIRTRHNLSIREIDALYVAGQQCPLYEVPAPHSRLATSFNRDFLQVHIYRMFQNCPDKPQWVRMDEIKRAFPDINDLNIRKVLKMCSDFKRVDALDSSCWVLRPDFRLPTEEEMRTLVTPEQCCAQFSMLAAEQRLKDAGYGGNVLFVPPDEEDEDDEHGIQLKIDDEIKAAPWNLTRGFIQSINGKCMLDLTGLADPTGSGEGFSYMTRSIRPSKQLVMGDTPVEKFEIEKPTAANAKILLKKMGVPDKEIKSLSQWELLDIARTITKKKNRGKGKSSLKIPKPRPMTTAQNFAKYKDDCQRIFDLQNRVLQSAEELSTDEEEVSDDEGSDVEEMGKIVEKLISDGTSYSELCRENEEKEREELVKMMMDDNVHKQNTSKNKPKKSDSKDSNSGPQSNRVLKINRTFRDANGREYTRAEFVRKSSVIDVYLKIRSTKDEAFINQFAALERAEKQKMMREKRNIEGQLLRLQQREHMLAGTKSSSKMIRSEVEMNFKHQSHDNEESASKPFIIPTSRKLYNSKMDARRKCGACGNPGHKKGNKLCPLYCGPVNVAMTEEEEEEYQRQMNVDDQNLVNVDGTKLKLSVKLIKRAEEMKKKTLLLRVPKDIVRKRKRPIVETHCDYLENKYQRTVNRRRVDPLIVLSNAFESILNEMRDLPDSDPFHFPVNAKTYPHYYTVITQPMDLQTIRENLRQRKYQSRKDFLEDVHQIVQNSTTFNGAQSPLTINANKMLNLCVRRMGEQEGELIRLEETISTSDDEASAPVVSRVARASRKSVLTSSRRRARQVVDLGGTRIDHSHDEGTLPNSIVDLSLSDTEDNIEVENVYQDERACPVVP